MKNKFTFENNEDLVTLLKNLKNERIRYKLSIFDMSLELEVTSVSYASWEKFSIVPKPENIEKMKNLLQSMQKNEFVHVAGWRKRCNGWKR